MGGGRTPYCPGLALSAQAQAASRLTFLHCTSLPQKEEGSEGRRESNIFRWNIYSASKPSSCSVHFSSTACCWCRLLKGPAHEGRLVLAVQHAGVSEGTRGEFPLLAPETLGCRGARTVPRFSDHIEVVCLVLILGVDEDSAGVAVKFAPVG